MQPERSTIAKKLLLTCLKNYFRNFQNEYINEEDAKWIISLRKFVSKMLHVRYVKSIKKLNISYL